MPKTFSKQIRSISVRALTYCIALLFVGAIFTACSSNSQAGIIFTDGPVSTNVNILPFTKDGFSTGTGDGNGTSITFLKFEADQELVIQGNGASEIASVNTPFSMVMFEPLAPYSFTVFELNPVFVKKPTATEFTLSAVDENNVVYNSTPFLIKGNSRVAAYTDMGSLIKKFTINVSSADIDFIKQVRINAVGGVIPPAVPEPASATMLLLGTGALLCIRKRRRSGRLEVKS